MAVQYVKEKNNLLGSAWDRTKRDERSNERR